MATSQRQYVARACESLLSLLLLEYLYCFYLDGSVLILLYRAFNYYQYRVMVTYSASKGGDTAIAAPELRARRTTPRAENDGAAVSVMEVPELESVYEQSRANIFVHCCWRFALVVLVHCMWLGKHYLNATPYAHQLHPRDPATTASARGEAEVVATQFALEVFFWKNYLRNMRFLDFAAAWEPFGPLPCALLVLDVAVLVIEYLVGLLVSVHVERVTSGLDDPHTSPAGVRLGTATRSQVTPYGSTHHAADSSTATGRVARQDAVEHREKVSTSVAPPTAWRDDDAAGTSPSRVHHRRPSHRGAAVGEERAAMTATHDVTADAARVQGRWAVLSRLVRWVWQCLFHGWRGEVLVLLPPTPPPSLTSSARSSHSVADAPS